MNSPVLSKLPLLATLALGTAIGGTATWWWSYPRPPTAPPIAASPAPETVNLPLWSARSGTTPTPLTAAQGRLSVDGLLGLRADYATRVDTLRALLVVLPDDGFARLLSGLAAQDNDDSHRLLDVALRIWIERDPAAAARWAVSNNRLASLALRAWVKVDPVAAAEWVARLTDPKQLKDLGNHTLPALFDQDPDRALALVMAMPDEIRPGLLRNLIEKLGKTDPAGAIRRFGAQLWDNGKGYNTLSPALREWVKTDPRATIDWLVAQPRQHAHQLGHHLGNLLNARETDWKQISAIVIDTPGIANLQRTLAGMLSNQGRKDPASVMQFLDATGDRNLRNRVLLQMASSYSNQEIEKTLPFALALPESAERNQKLNWLLSQWAKHDPTAALDWMGAHHDPGVEFASAAVQTGILVNIANQEPETAIAEWARIEDPKTRKDALQPLAQIWARTDPAAATRWMFEQQRALSPDEQNPYFFSNYSQMIFAWRKTDPEAALRWVEQASRLNPPPPGNNHHADPFKALGGDWNETADRVSTAQLLTGIDDPETRTRALGNHVRDWLKFDRKSAAAWLESNNALTAEQAAALIAEADKPGPGTAVNPF
ncbi:MAG: hypothetical protein ABII82_11725 [Verrucomicrobiota bacterium]